MWVQAQQQQTPDARSGTGEYNGGEAYSGAPPPAVPYGAPMGYQGNPQGYAGPSPGPPPPYPPVAATYGSPPPGGYPYTDQSTYDPKYTYGRPLPTAPSSTEVSPATLAERDDIITDHISVQIRHAFVRKVLCILCTQILVTFTIASVFGFVPVLRKFLLDHFWIGIICAVLAVILQCVLVCVPNLARKVPANFILMSLITMGYSVLIAFGAVASSPEAFVIALGTTFVVVVGLMLFACQTKYDFTACGPYVFVILIVISIFGICCIFFSNHLLHLVYSCLATLGFCLILVYDTQLVVGGKHKKYQYSVDDYVFAALTLYLDIIIIFMNTLALLDST